MGPLAAELGPADVLLLRLIAPPLYVLGARSHVVRARRLGTRNPFSRSKTLASQVGCLGAKRTAWPCGRVCLHGTGHRQLRVDSAHSVRSSHQPRSVEAPALATDLVRLLTKYYKMFFPAA